jgi:hypothetical protein
MKIDTGSRLNSEHFSELAQSLLASPEVAARAALLADAVCKTLAGSACALYSLRSSAEGAFWTALGVSDEISVVEPAIAAAAKITPTFTWYALSGPLDTYPCSGSKN